MLDREPVSVFRQDFRVAFLDPIDGSHSRTALQCILECLQLLLVADGIDFHTAIEKILYIPGHTQSCCYFLGEEAETYALHSAGHMKSLGVHLHKLT